MRYEQLTESDDNDGFSDWIVPIMENHRMACCDCGLVHEMEFEVLRVTKYLDKETAQVKPAKSGFMVRFRAKRHVRATGQRRRHLRESEVVVYA